MIMSGYRSPSIDIWMLRGLLLSTRMLSSCADLQLSAGRNGATIAWRKS